MTLSSGTFLSCAVGLCLLAGCEGDAAPGRFPAMSPGDDGIYHVHPGESIQAAIEAAARDSAHKTVKVHAGTYRPSRAGQALIWFNRSHDGVILEAEGEVVLTAQNPEIADKSAAGYPAVVNHVIYFGDGITGRTVVRGFRVTGANNFVTTTEGAGSVEPEPLDPMLTKGLFFYADGGGIKVFGRSYPTIEHLEIVDNYTSPCGGGISIEHAGFNQDSVTIRDCVFRNNRCQITGSAVDVLVGSSATISNCLFVGNVSNTGENYIGGADNPYNEEHGCGALTVFPNSQVTVDRCTFTGNWNGADDKGTGNSYTNCIFWKNTKEGGISPEHRYELDILDGAGVKGCFLGGSTSDLRGTIDAAANTLNASDPDFDDLFVPQAIEYAGVGYRPPDRQQ
ncbi:MAG: right-handed parallel beta-helix repeat-containing protein [Planctomycetaceae bacterium]